MTRSILLQDIAASAHLSGVDFGATIRPERVALEGRRAAGALPSGLRLHTLDAQAATDFETRILRAPGVVLHLILAGSAEAFIGPHRLRLERRAEEPVRMAFTRWARRRRSCAGRGRGSPAQGQHRHRLGLAGGARHPARTGSGRRRLSARDLARDGGRKRAGRRAWWRWTGRGRSLHPVAARGAGLRPCRGVDDAADRRPPGALRPAETERLRRLEERALQPGPMPDLAQIAEEAGMSLSSLQRLFRRAYGLSAKARIRDLRLRRAEAALRGGASVRAAAHLAGFVSVESFATAFRRQFGLPPSALGR
ncbi:helix-turn-helix domain-containing protein [Rhodobacter capsulatus]|uniref:helix-turn-helix domain-containing protein n=1 Tax=Rhodobacter capsulatus TaxID=1061 RepID=UPI004027D958